MSSIYCRHYFTRRDYHPHLRRYASLRHSLEELLSLSDDFTVAASHDYCRHAQEDVAASAPDVIHMDIDMPGMTGIEAVKRGSISSFTLQRQ